MVQVPTLSRETKTMFAKLRLIPALVVVAGLACSATAIAQPNGRAYGWGIRGGGQQAAYDNGYRAGYEQGEREARGRERYGYERHGRYRSGDYGYDNRYGQRNDYRDAFRTGFASGYDRGYYAYGGGRAVPRQAPNYGRYPTYPGYGGYGYYGEAQERGLREGYQKGRKDARDHDRYDPRRHNWYRDGDRGYKDRYGSRDQYKRVYRDAFEQGYAQGYRGW
jgi:hypothetical protein